MSAYNPNPLPSKPNAAMMKKNSPRRLIMDSENLRETAMTKNKKPKAKDEPLAAVYLDPAAAAAVSIIALHKLPPDANTEPVYEIIRKETEAAASGDMRGPEAMLA